MSTPFTLAAAQWSVSWWVPFGVALILVGACVPWLRGAVEGFQGGGRGDAEVEGWLKAARFGQSAELPVFVGDLRLEDEVLFGQLLIPVAHVSARAVLSPLPADGLRRVGVVDDLSLYVEPLSDMRPLDELPDLHAALVTLGEAVDHVAFEGGTIRFVAQAVERTPEAVVRRLTAIAEAASAVARGLDAEGAPPRALPREGVAAPKRERPLSTVARYLITNPPERDNGAAPWQRRVWLGAQIALFVAGFYFAVVHR